MSVRTGCPGTAVVRRAQVCWSGSDVMVCRSRQINVNNLVLEQCKTPLRLSQLLLTNTICVPVRFMGNRNADYLRGEEAIWKVFWIMNSLCLLEPLPVESEQTEVLYSEAVKAPDVLRRSPD